MLAVGAGGRCSQRAIGRAWASPACCVAAQIGRSGSAVTERRRHDSGASRPPPSRSAQHLWAFVGRLARDRLRWECRCPVHDRGVVVVDIEAILDHQAFDPAPDFFRSRDTTCVYGATHGCPLECSTCCRHEVLAAIERVAVPAAHQISLKTHRQVCVSNRDETLPSRTSLEVSSGLEVRLGLRERARPGGDALHAWCCMPSASRTAPVGKKLWLGTCGWASTARRDLPQSPRRVSQAEAGCRSAHVRPWNEDGRTAAWPSPGMGFRPRRKRVRHAGDSGRCGADDYGHGHVRAIGDLLPSRNGGS